MTNVYDNVTMEKKFQKSTSFNSELMYGNRGFGCSFSRQRHFHKQIENFLS